VKLSVPKSLAGVVGPCPSCDVLIQAPFPEAVTPDLQAPPYEQRTLPIDVVPPVFLPKPRQTPLGSEPSEKPKRVRPTPSGDRPMLERPSKSSKKHRGGRSLRILIPLAFLAIIGGVVYGVVSLLLISPNLKPQEKKVVTPAGEVKASLLSEEDNFESLTNEAAGKSDLEAKPSIPAVEVEQPVDGGVEALAILEKFLSMKTLKDRMPYIETRHPESELASSVLNAPLPEVLAVTVDVCEVKSIEQIVDYYYQVDFAGAEGVNPQAMLVRTRGTGMPKVVVDPFLDMFGGNFARFAEKPTEEVGTFQVIISAEALCYDDVPQPDKKYTLRILSRGDSKDIAKAFFGKRSKIGDMLQDETSGLTYGQARACTVFLRWNMEDDPENPFLEALDITALNWNP
jgi:hypothetical protein